MTALLELICKRIRENGPLPFPEFMSMALYQKDLGYYENGVDPGKTGDFYTSVSVGPLFGELLAAQFALWMEDSGRIEIVECGAHRGDLMLDIAEAINRTNPGMFERTQFMVIEPSSTRRNWQASRFAAAGLQVRWCEDWSLLPNASVNGVIYSNELLDAMPVKVWRWSCSSAKWFEMGVGLAGGELTWVEYNGPCVDDDLPLVPAELEGKLPDGFLTETSPAAESWYSEAGRCLGRGHLVSIDYGLPNAHFFFPQRAGGTLRTYSKHRPGTSVLDDPGGQDITASVNFSRIQSTGHRLGLETLCFEPQGIFLTKLLARLHALGKVDGSWAAARARAFRTLTSPEFLGGRFHVLIQTTQPR